MKGGFNGKEGFILTKRMNKMMSKTGLIHRRFILSVIEKRFFTVSLVLILSLFAFSSFVEAQTWPTSGSWTSLGTDKNEDGTQDDFRDVRNIYYYLDSSYLYLRMCCQDTPAFTKTSPPQDARYKWFIDLDGNSYISGGQVIEAEYLLFAEDTNDILPVHGEVYLLNDINGDGNFNEWEASPNYYSGGLVTNPNVAGYRIEGNCFDFYIVWSNIGNPANVWLIWTTDQENPNLEQSPETDHPDTDAYIGPIPHCTPQPDNNCNGIDDDCDGTADEHYVPTPTNCGVGVCAATGQLICVNGSTQNTCQPGSPTETPETSCADGKDNDCDGSTDGTDIDCGGAIPVGGFFVPANKFALVAPWITLVTLVTLIVASVIIWRKRQK